MGRIIKFNYELKNGKKGIGYLAVAMKNLPYPVEMKFIKIQEARTFIKEMEAKPKNVSKKYRSGD